MGMKAKLDKVADGSRTYRSGMDLEDRVKEYEAKLFSMSASERYAFRCVGYVPTHYDFDWYRAVAEYKRRKNGRKNALRFD